MSGRTYFVACCVAIVAFSGCAQPSSQSPSADLVVELDVIGQNFSSPVYATDDGTGSDRLYVVEQPGRILRLERGQSAGTLFLDIRDRVGSGGERGLLGLAFHEYAESKEFYVHYTNKDGDTVLARFSSDASGNGDPGSEVILLEQDQPYANHNGGMIEFGPDGFLYMGLGDGGSGGDPQENGQKLTTLLGKILRLDVSGSAAKCPATNPKLGEGTRCEIWSYGLRNPWRFSFDRETGDLFIGDVGQNKWEEIDHAPAASQGGENYGWNVYEGNHRFRAASIDRHVPPIFEYPTGPDGTCSVTGGYVYRGTSIPALKGRYVFGDYCSGTVWTLERTGQSWDRFVLLETGLRISSFGEDDDGEILVVDHGGKIHRLVSG